MKEFEFYKEFYYKEFERRNILENSLNLPIAIITALSSAIYFLLTTYDYSINCEMKTTFVILISISIILELIAIFFIIRAFSNLTSGFSYAYIPYPKELKNYHEELKNYYEEINNEEIDNENLNNNENNASKDFYKFLTEKLADISEDNAYLNDKKSGYLHQSKRFIVICLIFSLFSLTIYGINYFKKEKVIQKIEIVNKEY